MKWLVVEFVAVVTLVVGSLALAGNTPVSIPADKELVMVSGQMAKVRGVESTGTVFLTDDGSEIEVDLKSFGLTQELAEGQPARAVGYYRVIRGVEVVERQVLVITAITTDLTANL
jgi:hypothetical protein